MKFSRIAAALAGCLIAGSAFAQDVVRLGVANDRSGIYSDLGGLGSEIATRMAVEDFGGTVLGKKIEVIGGDTQNKVDIAGNMIRKWFDTQNVVALIDGGASSTGLAGVNIAKEKNRSAIISGGFAGNFSGAQCTNISTQWTPDTYALANATLPFQLELARRGVRDAVRAAPRVAHVAAGQVHQGRASSPDPSGGVRAVGRATVQQQRPRAKRRGTRTDGLAMKR